MAPWRSWIAANVRSTRKIYAGLSDPALYHSMRAKEDFVYFDHGYWNRGYSFRVIVGATHLLRQLDRPGDRIGTNPRNGAPTSPELGPPRKALAGGGQIVVIPPSEVVATLFRLPNGHRGWTEDMVRKIKAHTDRPIKVKKEKSPPLGEYLHGAHAVVTFGSVAGVEAAVMGYPVFSGPNCPTLPISAGTIENIETPIEHDREPWLRSLSYAQWTMPEIEKLNIAEYDYR